MIERITHEIRIPEPGNEPNEGEELVLEWIEGASDVAIRTATEIVLDHQGLLDLRASINSALESLA